MRKNTNKQESREKKYPYEILKKCYEKGFQHGVAAGVCFFTAGIIVGLILIRL